MAAANWTEDLANIIEAARIDDLPRPLCLSFTWTGDGHGQAHAVVITNTEAAQWELSARATGMDRYGASTGQVDGTQVVVIQASDQFEEHVSTTPGMVRL